MPKSNSDVYHYDLTDRDEHSAFVPCHMIGYFGGYADNDTRGFFSPSFSHWIIPGTEANHA